MSGRADGMFTALNVDILLPRMNSADMGQISTRCRRIIQQRDDRWRFLDRSPPRDGATYRALRTGLEPSMPYEDGLAARSHEPACTLSDAIACMLFYGMSLEDGQQKVFRIWAECLVVPISYSVGHATPLTSPLASPLDSLQNLCRRSQKSRSRTRS